MKFNFSPDQNFKDEAKRKFMAAFDISHAPARAPWFMFLARASMAALAMAAIVFGGASVYADTTNVPADHALYQFKRLGEDIRLAMAPPKIGASIQASLAARRAEEADDLIKRNPSSTLIAKLSHDADKAVNSSIADAAEARLRGGELVNLCGHLFLTLSSSSVAAKGELRGDINILRHFTKKCEVAAGDIEESEVSSTAATTAFESLAPSSKEIENEDMGSARFSAPSVQTMVAPTNSESNDLKIRIENYLNTHFPEGRGLNLKKVGDEKATAILDINLGRKNGDD